MMEQDFVTNDPIRDEFIAKDPIGNEFIADMPHGGVLNEVPITGRLSIDYGELGMLIVPVNEYPQIGKGVKSISRIVPTSRSVLIGEYGTVDLISVLNHISNSQPINTIAKMIIVGVGPDVPSYIEIGTKFYPKMRESHIIRRVFDPANDYSFEKIANRAKEDKDMLAAVAIAGNRDKSKVGLRMDFTTIDQDALTKLHNNKNLNNLIYKGKMLQFLNYYIMDYTNIDAIIYDI